MKWGAHLAAEPPAAALDDSGLSEGLGERLAPPIGHCNGLSLQHKSNLRKSIFLGTVAFINTKAP